VCEIGFSGRRRDSGVGCGDEREQHDEAEEEKDEEHVDAEGADQDHEADHGPICTMWVSNSSRNPKVRTTYIVMLWNICEELYGAPVAPPSAVKADVIWVMGSWLYAREHQWVP
jgi:hypothetical protein